MPAPQIISLLPAATEIICALGLQSQLIGRSHECDFPAEVTQLPVCTHNRLAPNLSSAQIDEQVKQLVANALSVYEVDAEKIKLLAPDVIITQDQCAACAVSLPQVEEALAAGLDKPVRIISLQPSSLEEIFANIMQVAEATGAVAAAHTLVEDLQERIDIIEHKLKFINDKPTVACIEWMDPLMASGNWVPQLVQIAGGTPIMAQPQQHSPYIQWEDLRLQDPDIIVVMACGFSIERTMREIDALLQLPNFTELKAVVNKRFYITDGNQYFNRPGPRIVDSVEILAEIINPKQFIFGYEGSGWVSFG